MKIKFDHYDETIQVTFAVEAEVIPSGYPDARSGDLDVDELRVFDGDREVLVFDKEAGSMYQAILDQCEEEYNNEVETARDCDADCRGDEQREERSCR